MNKVELLHAIGLHRHCRHEQKKEDHEKKVKKKDDTHQYAYINPFHNV